MKAPISELTRRILDSGEGHKLYQDKFEFEGKTYVVKKGLPSYKELMEKEEED